MDSSETGVVYLEDLPQKEIFISLKSKFFNILNNKIRKFGIYNLSIELNVSKRIVLHWLNDGSLIRLDVLSKICTDFNLDFKKQIDYIRGKDGHKIKNPKLPFDFTSCDGVRGIAGILGDGGIPKNRSNPFYSNTNKKLTYNFARYMKFVFGDLDFNSRDNLNGTSVCTVLEFPTFCKKVFIELGLKEGKKVETNQKILPFIFNLDKIKKISFISQLLDDEGTVNQKAQFISFTNVCLSNKKSCLLNDLQKILIQDFDIDSLLYKGDRYKSSRGKDRQTWKLQINSQVNLRKLKQILTLNHIKKEKKLDNIIKSSKLLVFPKRRVNIIYTSFMGEIEKEKGFFTSYDLSQKSGMQIDSCRNTILKFRKLGLIKCVEEKKSGNIPDYAKYILK